LTEAQTFRIAQLEGEVETLKLEAKARDKKIDDLERLRDQIMGMGWATRLFIKIVLVVAGAGGLAAIVRLMNWLSSPMTLPRAH
jgi:hypothetical protein